MKNRKVSVRLEEDETEFLNSLLTDKGIKPSTAIRFCINFVRVMKGSEEFKQLIDKLPKDIKV